MFDDIARSNRITVDFHRFVAAVVLNGLAARFIDPAVCGRNGRIKVPSQISPHENRPWPLRDPPDGPKPLR